MKSILLKLLVCPLCQGQFTVSGEQSEGAEIMEGTLVCAGCGE